MKNLNLLIFLLFLTANYSCEKDDLCPESTPTTPKLIIDLNDNIDPDEPKNVFDLRIQGVGNDNVLPGYNIISATKQIILPLRTDANTTSYKLHIDYALNDNGTPEDTSDDFVEGNEDIIQITYTTEEIYVSRACGYKTVFRNVTLLLDPNDNDRWIINKESLIENQSVEDETTTHFILYH